MANVTTRKRYFYRKFWFQNLSQGMDQATDTSLTKGSQKLKNVVLDYVGNWSSRPGSSLPYTKMASGKGYGLWSYNKHDGTHKFFAVNGGSLYLLDEVTGWAVAAAATFPGSTRVDGIDFLNRSYVGSADGDTALKYTTGGSLTSITPKIGGSILATAKNILAVGGNLLKKNVIFASDPFTDNFFSATGTAAGDADTGGVNYLDTTATTFTADMEGAILYNSTDNLMALITKWFSGTRVKTDTDTSTWDNDTIYVLQNNFKLDNACTGITNYSENFMLFDEFKRYEWDPTASWSREFKDEGCVNYRTIKVINKNMIWVNRNKILKYDDQLGTTDITGKLNNNVTGMGIWDLLNRSNLADLCAEIQSTKGKYWLSLGTLSSLSGAPVSGESNVVIVLDLKSGNWTYRTYPEQIVAFARFIDSNGNENLYGIGKSNSAVWKMDDGTTDTDASGGSVAITTVMDTPHHSLFDDPSVTTKILQYFVMYTSSGSVTVGRAVDRGAYETVATLPISSNLVCYEIEPIPESEGFVHSMEFSSTTPFTIEGYGFYAEKLHTTGLPSE